MNSSGNLPLISVIIPIYNNYAYLERCLNSVMHQSYKNIEVIMVNDGSTDESELLCKHFESIDKRFQYIYQENAGVSAARNNGLRNSRGDFFTFIDSDDWVEREYCEKMFEKSKEGDSDIVFCGINYCYGAEKKEQNESTAMTNIIQKGHVEHFLPDVDNYAIGSSCRTLFRRSKIGELRFEESLHIYEDLLFLLESIILSNKLAYIKDPLYNYDIPQTSYVRKYYRPGMTDKCFLIGNKLYDILCRLGRNDWAKAELFKQYSKAVVWIFVNSTAKKHKYDDLKKHQGLSSFNSNENYVMYKKLYKYNKLKIVLIHYKLFRLFDLCASIKHMFKKRKG